MLRIQSIQKNLALFHLPLHSGTTLTRTYHYVEHQYCVPDPYLLGLLDPDPLLLFTGPDPDLFLFLQGIELYSILRHFLLDTNFFFYSNICSINMMKMYLPTVGTKPKNYEKLDFLAS